MSLVTVNGGGLGEHYYSGTHNINVINVNGLEGIKFLNCN